MNASFARQLCGFRSNGNPSTSDNNDPGSIEWGRELFRVLDVQADAPEVPSVGSALEEAVTEDLSAIRPDLGARRSRSAHEFEQYRHLRVFRDFVKAYQGPDPGIDDVMVELRGLLQTPGEQSAVEELLRFVNQVRVDGVLVDELVDTMPEESMLKIDITVGSRPPGERLLVAVSSKWTLRTDRAQDCVSQGSKLVALRRGHMPHYAVLTMEPRPAMLKLIAYGSGSVDCIYHLALEELRESAASLERRRGMSSWRPRVLLERMVAQGRVRDYSQLQIEVAALPAAPLPAAVASP